jgi:hypothetical protein
MVTYLNAVIVCNPGTPRIKARKYRNIKSTEECMSRFERFAWAIPGARDCNYYFQDRSFYRQVRNPNYSPS